MAILSYNEVTSKKVIMWNGEPYLVLSSWVFRKQMRKPVNQTKLRNVKTGKVVEVSFHQAETIEEADIEKKPIVYIYRSRGEAWFHEEGNPGKRFMLPEEQVADELKYVKEKTPVGALIFNEEVIGLEIPIKVDLAVTEAPPSIKGNTAQGGSKQVTVETGAVISTPLFINVGDVIRINTESGEYVERAEKR